MGEGKLCTSPEPKLLYQSIPNFERMITSVGYKELPNFVEIGSTGAAPHVGVMYTVQIPVFFLLFSSAAASYYYY